jgi:hypothetical protein
MRTGGRGAGAASRHYPEPLASGAEEPLAAAAAGLAHAARVLLGPIQPIPARRDGHALALVLLGRVGGSFCRR